MITLVCGSLPQILQDLRAVDVAGIAGGGIHAQPFAQFAKAIVDHLPHPPRLGKNRDITGPGFGEGKVAISIHLRISIDDTLAIGAKNANPGAPGEANQFGFQAGPFRPHFLKTGSIDDGYLHTLAGAVGQNAGHLDVFDDDVGQVHVPQDMGNGGVGSQALNFRVLGMNRIDGAGKLHVLQVSDNPVADGERPVAGADDGYGARPEQEV